MKRTDYPRGTVPGTWAKRVCPAWCFSIFDAAKRLGCSVRHVRRLIEKYNIQKGLLTRPVRLADGRIVRRRLTTLTPTALQALMLAHAGYRQDMKLQKDSPNEDTMKSSPLSSDLELRPRGAEPVSVSRAVGPSIGEWVEETLLERERLHQLADDARDNGDLASQLACITKAADLNLKLLRLSLENV